MNIKEKILAFSIAIVFVLFVAYGTNVFIEEPKMDYVCKGVEYNIEVESCPEQNIALRERAPVPAKPGIECWCNQDCSGGECVRTGPCYQRNPEREECEERYGSAREKYNRNVFFVSIITGIIVLVMGGAILRLESVGSGLMGGGTLLIFYGTIRYWGDLNDIFRFLILGVALGILIWIGYRKLNPHSKKN